MLTTDDKARERFFGEAQGMKTMNSLLKKAEEANHTKTIWKTCHFLSCLCSASTSETDHSVDKSIIEALAPLKPQLYTILEKHGATDVTVSEKVLVLLYYLEPVQSRKDASSAFSKALKKALQQFGQEEDHGFGSNTPLEELLH